MALCPTPFPYVPSTSGSSPTDEQRSIVTRKEAVAVRVADLNYPRRNGVGALFLRESLRIGVGSKPAVSVGMAADRTRPLTTPQVSFMFRDTISAMVTRSWKRGAGFHLCPPPFGHLQQVKSVPFFRAL